MPARGDGHEQREGAKASSSDSRPQGGRAARKAATRYFTLQLVESYLTEALSRQILSGSGSCGVQTVIGDASEGGLAGSERLHWWSACRGALARAWRGDVDISRQVGCAGSTIP